MPKAAPRFNPTLAMPVRTHQVQQPAPNYGKGRGGRPWRRIRDRVMARDKYQCQPCKAAGRLTVATQCDHVIPQSKGGTDDDQNLQAICGPCHEAKTRAEAAMGARAHQRRGGG